MKVDEFESLDLDLINEAPWPLEAPGFIRSQLVGRPLAMASGATPLWVANKAAQFGVTNPAAIAYAWHVANNKTFQDPSQEFVGDAAALATDAAALTLANKAHNRASSGLQKTSRALRGYYDDAFLARRPSWLGGKNPWGKGLVPGTTNTQVGSEPDLDDIDDSKAKPKPKPGKLVDLPADDWTKNIRVKGGGSFEDGFKAGTENAELRMRTSTLEKEVAELKAREKAAETAGRTAEVTKLRNELGAVRAELLTRIDAKDLKSAGLQQDILQAIEKGEVGRTERLKKQLAKEYGLILGGNGTFQQGMVDAQGLSDAEQKARYGNPNSAAEKAAADKIAADKIAAEKAEREAAVASAKAAQDAREAELVKREAEITKREAAERAELKAREKAATLARQAEFDKMKATPVTAADERAAAERLAKRGKTKVTAAEIAKEIENPTVVKAKIDPVTTAYKKEYGGQKGIPEPKPESPAEMQARQEAEELRRVQIKNAKEATEKALKKQGIKDVVIKAGTSTGTSASSVVIGATDDAVKLSKTALAKEALEKMGIVTSAGTQAVKRAAAAAVKQGGKYFALSFIPILNVALWGHDAYAVTAAAVKSMDPEEQDKSDAGRHRQVALQQSTLIIMSDASMDTKIEQLEQLFGDNASDTTKQAMLAQIKARQEKELVGGRQHFRTANPEFQAQLDKGPSKLGPQEVVPRNEDIWNSLYDQEEQRLPVTFDAEGNLATGPNTKADFKDSLDGLVVKQAEYLTWKQLHPTTSSHPINAKIDAMENAIAEVRVAIRSAPEDRKTAFKNYVFNVLAQTETQVASNESAIMKGTLLAEGPSDWMATFRNWVIDRENLPKSGGAIRGKTSLAKGVKDLDPLDIEDLTKVKPRHDIEGNVWKRISGMSTKDQPFYDPKLDIKGFKPDTVAQAKADYKKPKVDKPVLTVKDLAKSANLRKAFIKTFNTPVTSTNVDDVIATNTGKNVSSAISKAISSPQFVPSGKEQKMLDRIKDKRKKYSKYTKAEQTLMIKAGLTKNTFKQAYAQASANSDSLKIMKLKNGKTIKYFVWNGKKYSV